MSVQGILFDLDGTLADTLPLCIHVFRLTVEHFTGKILGDEEISSKFGPSEEGVLEQLIPGRLAETLPYYLGAYERHHKMCNQLFPGVEMALENLKERGKGIAIVTSKGVHSAAISVRILGLNRWIDIVEAGFLEKADKPHSIRLVLDRWRLPPDQAAYVGDTPYDMAAAKETGLLALGAAWAKTSTLNGKSRVEADFVFKNIDSFLRWIEQN